MLLDARRGVKVARHERPPAQVLRAVLVERRHRHPLVEGPGGDAEAAQEGRRSSARRRAESVRSVADVAVGDRAERRGRSRPRRPSRRARASEPNGIGEELRHPATLGSRAIGDGLRLRRRRGPSGHCGRPSAISYHGRLGADVDVALRARCRDGRRALPWARRRCSDPGRSAAAWSRTDDRRRSGRSAPRGPCTRRSAPRPARCARRRAP